MSEEQYLSRIKQLEKEIEYLHGLLDNAGISYRREAKDLDDLSPDRNLAFEEDQGARIHKVTITKQYVQYFYYLFKGRKDVYSKRAGKANEKTGKHGYYTQCWNFWKDGICPKKNNPKFTCGECQNQRYKELTGQIMYGHLLGEKEDASDVIGLYPMFPDETVNFLVFDFDCHDDIIGVDDGANLDSEWIRNLEGGVLMATRRDSKHRVLRRGESIRPDGKYQFEYHVGGKPHFVYSWRLEPADKLPVGKKP